MGRSESMSKAKAPIMPSARTTRSNSNASQEPPAKRPRLKLNLRKPSSNDGDTIAVSRPKRVSAGRSRYSEHAVDSEDEIDTVTVKQSPAASSGLSSPISASTSVKNEVVATDARVGGRDSYGDFMSYYIADGDDAEDDPAPKPKREAKKEKSVVREKQQRKPRAKKMPTPPAPAPVDDRPHPASQPPLKPASRPSSRHNPAPKKISAPRPVAIHPQAHPKARPLPVAQPPPVHNPMPQPRPTFEPPVLEEITVKYHASVPDKVKKLQTLSAALTNFGGVPSTGKIAAPAEDKKTQIKKQKKNEAPVDNFLAMFDDDDSDEKDDSEAGIECKADEPRFLEHTGDPDGPLTYGIQFIMNALKSWAQQRLHQQALAAAQETHAPSTKDVNTTSGPDGPSPLGKAVIPSKQSLSDTPEGKAIAAFRDVVESGCLRVNVVLPAELAIAVRHLYVQIDQLINQGGKAPPEPWQPMSYIAQIKAHQIRLDRWREQQANAQQTIGRHQQHNSGLYPAYNSMAPPPMPGGNQMLFQNQVHGSSDRRRSTPYGPSDPGHDPSTRMSLPAGVVGAPPYPAPGGHAGSPPITANYRLPRSGQTMNFSFAPENLAAIQAFGPGAFPAVNHSQGPASPHGPTSASPIVKSPLVSQASQERPASRGGIDTGASAESAHDSIEVSGTDTHAHPTRPLKRASGFTAVNAPKDAHDTRASASSSRPRSPGLTRSDAVVLEDD